MSEQHLRKAIEGAIQRSDEWDVERISTDYYKSVDRGWSRLNSFFIAFCSELTSIDHELANELDVFVDRVMRGGNPMLDAAPGAQEKLK